MSHSLDQDGGQLWKVYIPYKLFDSPCGYILGFFSSEKRIVCVVSLSEDILSDDFNIENDNLQYLGYWHGSQKYSNGNRKLHSSTIWMDLYISRENSRACNFQQVKANSKEPSNSFVTCILYDPRKVSSSYLLCDKGRFSNLHDEGLSNMDTLVHFLFQYYESYVRKVRMMDNQHMLIQDKSRKTSYCFNIVATLIGWVYFAMGTLLDNRLKNCGYLKPLIDHIAFLHQIELKYLQVKKSRTLLHRELFKDIRCLNVNTRFILDMMLGVFLMVLLMRSGATEIMADYIITWADGVVIWLNKLLDWLMGVPAGLKLNSQLDQFLGRFFHYHIYLWTGYLTLLKPVLAPLLWYSSIVGILGFSMQLCLLQDVFSTLTIHIYCFYVYAARLYYFQLYGLSSLWRLFRGKKWNVLRRRVDSASYDVDQLFVGTLLFTILLFLLPTTALYYVVFLGLRLLVLSLTGIVSKTVSMINSLPIHGLLLRLIRSNSITGDVMLTVLPDQTSKQCLFVSMQTIHVSYSCVVNLLGEKNVRMGSQPQYTWGSLLHSVLIGELIYPWVENASQSDKK